LSDRVGGSIERPARSARARRLASRADEAREAPVLRNVSLTKKANFAKMVASVAKKR
jgi:hypothetical protein